MVWLVSALIISIEILQAPQATVPIPTVSHVGIQRTINHQETVGPTQRRVQLLNPDLPTRFLGQSHSKERPVLR